MGTNEKSRTVLVTGVSTGIGRATAQALVKKGYLVFGSVRKASDGVPLTTEWGDQFVPLVFDVTDQAAIAEARKTVEARLGGQGLGGLVNNSGIAFGGPLLHQPLETIRQHFEVNVLGLLAVTREFAPLLGACPDPRSAPGRIVNISSVAGKLGAPYLGAYVGSKHAVEGLSLTLRRELLLYGIDVIVVGPGAVNTPIWDKGTDPEPYRNTPYFSSLEGFSRYFAAQGRNGYPPDFLGEKIAAIFEIPKPKARYALVPGWVGNWLVPRVLPTRVLDRIIGKATGLLK